ncbi:hypothetical protein GIB67_038931 [Kingdonia uniflora]|uniref:mannosyl-glycoprotein endo-beta-N-acetylglucosaminidase n=1 Tax=Kingdonia uniflora TaxID=39325 RepID=A0A7J7LQL4_9MAGN|nr:hypothetical protein GIB67_038931 [Kingdonia uniflora]
MKKLLLSIINRETLIQLRNLLKSTQHFFFSSSTMNHHQESNQTDDPPPPFDPLVPSTPISYPIKLLQDLESRSYFDSFHYPFNISSVPLSSGASGLDDRGRILVCHDMEGGYVDDKWVQGGTNEEAYAIWHWYLMDVFVYFSHNLVTLPPPCWTNAAHIHGVRVLGTFIMEWDEGKVNADKLLLTKESAQMYAERLAELAAALGFDGWLINMEVQLDVAQIPNLKEFVSHLTKTMHSSVPGSLVIWYDSVTKDGNLSWQNQLNDENKPFFDLCDGIFVNYTWEEGYPKLSATVAGERKYDVYMGIDVFGRGTYGGGQWTTNVALDVLKKDDVSAAIFAPGWVYESKQPPDFQTAQNRWWGLVEKSWGILQHYPKVLPFYSNFDQGHGYHFSVDGGELSQDPWNNISRQSFQVRFPNRVVFLAKKFQYDNLTSLLVIQPVLEYSLDPTPKSIPAIVDFKEASYSGGGNISFKGTLENRAYSTTILFQGELPVKDLPIHLIYSVKSDGSSLLGLSLEFSSTTNQRKSVFVASQGKTPLLTMNQFASKFDKIIMPFQVKKLERENRTSPGWIIQESSITMNGYRLTEIHVVCYKSERDLREFESEQAPLSEGSKLHLGSSLFDASIGHITIRTPEQNQNFPPSTSWVVDGELISWVSGSQGSKTVSLKIVWRLKGGDNKSLFPKYNIYVEKQPGSAVEFLSVARVEAFYVSDLVVSSGISSLKFIIQVCGADGASQKLDSSPAFTLNVEGKQQRGFYREHISIEMRQFEGLEVVGSREAGGVAH